MAPKRPSPLEEPPAASSSSEEIESEEEESSAEEEEEEIASPPPSVLKKPTGKTLSTPSSDTSTLPQSSSDDEDDDGSDSDSDSDSDPSPGKPHLPSAVADLNVKPITSKPMDDTAKPKKPPASATPTKSVTAAKRPIESVKDSQRKKKKVAEEGLGEEGIGKKSGDDPKKHSSQRVWSEDDEIIILKGMHEYYSKKGTDPWVDMNAYYDFIKKSLHVDVSRDQLINKMRHLKKKFQNNVVKGEMGEDPIFTKPHEQKVFELSKKIWGSSANNVGDYQVKSTVKARKSSKVSNGLALPKPEAVPLLEVQKVEEDQNLSQNPYLGESMQLGTRFNMSLPCLGESIVKEGMGLIGSSKAKELEEKWKKLQVTEIEVYLKQLDLMKEQMKLILDAVKSSMS